MVDFSLVFYFIPALFLIFAIYLVSAYENN